MAAFSKYKIDEDWETEVYLYWNCKYVLEDRNFLETLQKESWCRCCGTIVAGEFIPSMQEIENEIRRVTDPNDKIHKVFGRGTIDRILADARIRLQWRPTRNSPPRCLDCQSTDIINIPAENFVDPVSGTKFRLLSCGHASMATETRRRLTPEGLLFEKDDNGLLDM